MNFTIVGDYEKLNKDFPPLMEHAETDEQIAQVNAQGHEIVDRLACMFHNLRCNVQVRYNEQFEQLISRRTGVNFATIIVYRKYQPARVIYIAAERNGHAPTLAALYDSYKSGRRTLAEFVEALYDYAYESFHGEIASAAAVELHVQELVRVGLR